MPTRRPHTPGRPAHPPDRTRTRKVDLRLTPAELARVQTRAGRACLTRAAYLRQAALRGAPPPAVPVLNIRSVGQLGRLANNLNKLAKLAHQGRLTPALLPLLHDLLAEVSRLRRLLVGLPPRPDTAPASPRP